VRKFRLRTKFLLSLVAISAGLTAATLLIVRGNVQNQVRASIGEDLRASVSAYRSFASQRELALSRSAELVADLPLVRALMTTQDAATIQDASARVWRLSGMSGSDLLVLAGRQGNLLAVRSGAPGPSRETVEKLLRRTLQKGEQRDWWFDGGNLYEIWVQPIYFGESSENQVTGYLALGDAVNAGDARLQQHLGE